MSTTRLMTSTHSKCVASRSKEQPAFRASTVLAERNPAVAAVGAWVESGQDCPDNPAALALLTEEIQAERRRENEENLQRFQDEVRHRVAQQAQVSKKRQPSQDEAMLKPDRRILQQQYQIWEQHASAGERLSARQRSSMESNKDMKQVRLRLAACRMSPRGETTSDLPGGEWNVFHSRHKAGSRVLREEQEEEEEEEWEEEEEGEGEEGDDHLFTSQHECPLVLQKIRGPVLQDTDTSQPDPGFQSNQRILWPLTNQEELKKQRQSQFLMHRRLYMSMEREQVKENKQHRKHLKRTARIKNEKEQNRLVEEKKMERLRQVAEARQKLEERELLILQRLKLEEEERAVEQQRRRGEEKGKVAARYIEALRAQMKERLPQEKLELPPLCCCASSFWDSHPDTCANNCVFYNNPKAYAKALQSTMLSLDLH